MRRRARSSIAGALVAAILAPDAASAHGIAGRAGLPVPAWLFAWAAAAVLVLSFVALSSLWSVPRLQHGERRRLCRVPAALTPVCGVVGVALFALVVYAGYAGVDSPNANFDPTFIYVIFWVGVPLASAFAGDFFAAFSPWRAIARAGGWVRRRAGGAGLSGGVRFVSHSETFRTSAGRSPGLGRPRPYPARLGRWPVVAGLVGFGWLELVYHGHDKPALLASLAIGYFVVMLGGIALFGLDCWTERGDAFGAYFNLISRLSPFEVRDHTLYLRPPLSAATELELVPGTVALILTVIGITTFDGASNGVIWKTIGPHIQSVFSSLGAGDSTADELSDTVGLLIAIGVVTGFFYLGVRGMKTISRRLEVRALAGGFAHTLIPIAFAYVLAHYFSLLVWQGQAIGYLASNPLGHHSDLFGTADWHVDYRAISFAAIWYVQVAALVLGHVCGLILAHDRALAIFQRPYEAARSQYWMLVVMVGFTCMGLWLLSAVNA
jgi:hypothetical protein